MSLFDYLQYLTTEKSHSFVPKAEKSDGMSNVEINYKLQKIVAETELSPTKLRKIWVSCLKGLFFSEMQRSFLFTPTQKYSTTSTLKAVFQRKIKVLNVELKKEETTLYVAKLNNDPLHFIITLSSEKVGDLKGFLELQLAKQIIISVIPELGYATYWPLEKDDRLKYVMKLLVEIFKNIKEVRVNALLLRKFSTHETLQRLVISTPPEIAGFTGLDGIRFVGSDVMMGLTGLKRRHDAEVDKLTKVGPFTDVESQNMRLKAGKGVQFKRYGGIESFLKLLKI